MLSLTFRVVVARKEGGHCQPSSGGPLCSGHRPSEPSWSAQPPSFPHSLFCPTLSLACNLHPNLMKSWYPHFLDTAQSREKMCSQVTHWRLLWPECEPGVSAPKPGPVPLCPVLLGGGSPTCDHECGWVGHPSSCWGAGQRADHWALGSRDRLAQGSGHQPRWQDGKSAVPVTSFVACLRAVFRNFEWLVTSHGCSFRPARSGQISGISRSGGRGAPACAYPNVEIRSWA